MNKLMVFVVFHMFVDLGSVFLVQMFEGSLEKLLIILRILIFRLRRVMFYLTNLVPVQFCARSTSDCPMFLSPKSSFLLCGHHKCNNFVDQTRGLQ